MTRWTIGVLLAINLGLAVWNLGVLSPWGWGPHDGREPERLDQQLRPEAIQLSLPVAGSSAPAVQADVGSATLPASAPASNP